MHPLIQDVRFSLRLMWNRPGRTCLVLAALVLGIGLNTAIFSVLNAVLLRPLPVFEPDRVVWLHTKMNQTGTPLGTSYPDYLDWSSQNHSFEEITPIRALTFTMTGNGPAEHLKVTGISASGFKTWGVNTILGRGFTAQDDRPGAARVVVLNFPFWQRKFGGDPNVVGTSLVLDDQSFTVIGVLQPTPIAVLHYPDVFVANGPMMSQRLMERDARYFFPLGRLKPHISQAQAQAEMDTIASCLAAQYPRTNKDMGVRLESVVEELTADGRKPLLLLITASTIILLLAIVNVITLFMGNTIERGQELSVRLAIGATRSSLLRQLFIQALTFAIIGSAAGLLVAKVGLAFFLHRFPAALHRFQETTFDFRVVLAAIGTAFLVTFAATVAPAIYAVRLEIGNELRAERSSLARPKHRLLGRGALIFVEVALASGFSLVSGLMIKSLYEVEKIDLGFNPQQILSFQINLPPNRYKEAAKQSAFYKLAIEKLRSLPGMESISAISGLPLTTQGEINALEVDAQSPLSGKQLVVEDESILPGFFRTMRLPLLEGRDFTDADREGAPFVVIVDDILAAKLWPGQNPLGKRVRMTGLRNQTWHWLEVIGVVRETKHFGGPEAKVAWMQLYVPQYQDPTPMLSFVVNTSIPEDAVKRTAEKTLHELDNDLPVENFESMNGYLETFLSGRKAGLVLLSAFSGIGIVLGMIGIYGVVATAVVQRRREIAIRMALGSSASRAILLITRLGLIATLAGLAIGSAIALSLTRVLASFLYAVSALDPTIYLLTAVLLLVLALVASTIPAVKLLRFNIQEILRR